MENKRDTTGLVRVQIHAYQRVQYFQEVWMKPEEFERINAIEDDSISDEIESYIDVMDVLDADNFEDVELMLLKESVPDGQ